MEPILDEHLETLHMAFNQQIETMYPSNLKIIWTDFQKTIDYLDITIFIRDSLISTKVY